MLEQRFDRQMRIEGWNQSALAEAKVAIVGDGAGLTSLYVLASAALGLARMVVIAPRLDEGIIEVAGRVNPALALAYIEGFYTHPILEGIFGGCRPIVDLSQYGLANKLLLEKGYREGVPIVRGFCYRTRERQGLKVFTYLRGREWEELREVVSTKNLPAAACSDPVLDLIASGIALEETKSLLMGEGTSEEVITYETGRYGVVPSDARICVVGAGALGNFVGMGLACCGFRKIVFLDPDVVDVTNLNRQVFFYDAIGSSKAVTLSERLNRMFGIESEGEVAAFGRETDISPYEAMFDCVDDFETSIILSERCKEERKVLISGGTSAHAGQAVVYEPNHGGPTPAELLGLYDIVATRQAGGDQRGRGSCEHRPDPSVIMVNQVIGGLMVDAFRTLLAGGEPRNVFYDSRSQEKILY